MIKILKINKEQLIRFGDSEPFILVENEGLFFDFDTFYNLSNAIMTVKNNAIVSKLKVKPNLEIPKDLLFAGRLEICLDLFLDGQIVKHWDCLPIKIIEHEGKLKCFEEFREEINALEKRVKALEEQHKIIL